MLDRAISVSTMLTKTANTPIKPWQLLPKFGKLATIEKREKRNFLIKWHANDPR